MNKELQLLGELILSNKYDIAKEVHTDRLAGVQMTESQKREFQQLEQQILDIRADFIGLFGDALLNHGDKDDCAIYNWGLKIGKYMYDLGTPLDEALKDTSFYRTYLWKTIRESKRTKLFS